MCCGKPRQRWHSGLALTLGVLILSCSLGDQPVIGELPPPIAGQAMMPQGQRLPITAIAVVGNTRIHLEVANTPAEQELGLMFRDSLADDRGMLFPFQPARPVGFWMKDCRMSLDMIFIRLGKVVGIAANRPPCTTEPCPVYPSLVPIDQVLELRGGRAAELGIGVGDAVKVNFLADNKK
jgi:uncharacterized protein